MNLWKTKAKWANASKNSQKGWGKGASPYLTPTQSQPKSTQVFDNNIHPVRTFLSVVRIKKIKNTVSKIKVEV